MAAAVQLARRHSQGSLAHRAPASIKDVAGRPPPRKLTPPNPQTAPQKPLPAAGALNAGIAAATTRKSGSSHGAGGWDGAWVADNSLYGRFDLYYFVNAAILFAGYLAFLWVARGYRERGAVGAAGGGVKGGSSGGGSGGDGSAGGGGGGAAAAKGAAELRRGHRQQHHHHHQHGHGHGHGAEAAATATGGDADGGGGASPGAWQAAGRALRARWPRLGGGGANAGAAAAASPARTPRSSGGGGSGTPHSAGARSVISEGLHERPLDAL